MCVTYKRGLALMSSSSVAPGLKERRAPEGLLGLRMAEYGSVLVHGSVLQCMGSVWAVYAGVHGEADGKVVSE